MGMLENNRKAYDDSSLLELAKKNAAFYGKRSMLLVHGTGDGKIIFICFLFVKILSLNLI